VLTHGEKTELKKEKLEAALRREREIREGIAVEEKSPVLSLGEGIKRARV